MKLRQRLITAVLWLGVAAVMTTTLEPTVPSSAGGLVRLFVVALAVFLAAVYAFDPWNVVSRYHSFEE